MTILACMVSQKSLKKNFIIQSMERKKIGQIHGRISRRRLGCNPTIKYIIINLHTIYDYSSLNSFTEIWDKKFHYSKYGKKANGTNTGKNKQEKAGSQSHNTIHHYQPAYHTWLFQLAGFHRNLWQKIPLFEVWKRTKSDKYREE